MQYTENGLIKTTDSALVTFLTIKGYNHESIETSDGQALFIYKQSAILEQEISSFYSNAGNFLKFHKSYRQVLKDAKAAVRESMNGRK